MSNPPHSPSSLNCETVITAHNRFVAEVKFFFWCESFFNIFKMYNKMNGYGSFRNSRWLRVRPLSRVLSCYRELTQCECRKKFFPKKIFFFISSQKKVFLEEKKKWKYMEKSDEGKTGKKIVLNCYFSFLSPPPLPNFFPTKTRKFALQLQPNNNLSNWITEEVAVASSRIHYHQES